MTALLDPAAEKLPVVLGECLPRLSHYSEGSGPGLGEEASIYAETFTLSLLDWQDTVLDMSMRQNASGKWANRDVCLIVSRQNGKGSILTARCLYGLFVLHERIIHTAHEFKTASDAYGRIKGYIEARPGLARRTHFKNQYGLEEITVYEKTKLVGEPVARLKFLARTAGSGRGLACDLLILDEAYELTEAQTRALQPTQITSENPQTWYTSSAVDQVTQPNGLKFAEVRRRGIARKPRVCLAEWSAEKGDDREDYRTWAKANPSMCRLKGFDLQTMLDLRESSSREGFDVEYLSIGDWPEASASETVVDLKHWATLGSTRTNQKGPLCIAIEMTSDRKWISIAAAQATSEFPERVRLEVGYHAATSDEAVEYLGYLNDLWTEPRKPFYVIGATSPAMSLWPKLARIGIEPEQLTAAQNAAATGGFLTDVDNGLIVHSFDDRVSDALKGAQLKDLAGGAKGWDYRSPCVLSPLQAITLARYGLIMFTEEKKGSALPDYDEDTSGQAAPDELDMGMDPLTAGF